MFVVRIASNSFPSGYKESLVEFPQHLRSRHTVESDPKTLHEQEERRLFYVAMTRAMDELYLCGKAGSERKQPAPPKGYMRELVSYANSGLCAARSNGVCYRPKLASPRSMPPLPTRQLPVSQWTQLPPRQDGRLLELSASASAGAMRTVR